MNNQDRLASLNDLYNAYERQVRHLSLSMTNEEANRFMERSHLAKRITALEKKDNQASGLRNQRCGNA